METTEGCSRHLGEFIQSHCSKCDELLCLKCLAKGKHNGHDIVDYRSYLSKRQRDAENLLRRLRSLQQRAENHNSIVTCYREDFNNCYGKSMKNLESFEEVKAGMLRWKKGLIAELEKKKKQQLQNINTAICNSESNLDELVIKLPKVTVLVPARNNLHRKVTELTPNPVNDFYKLTKRHMHHSNSFSHRSTTSSVVSDYTYMHAISPSPSESESVISHSSEDLLHFTTTGGKHHDSDQSDTETYISVHSSLSTGDLQSESIDISQGAPTAEMGSFIPELPLKIPQETRTIPQYNRKLGRIQSNSQHASANSYLPGSYAPTSTNILESMIPNVVVPSCDLTSENIKLGPTDDSEDVYEDITATPPETCTTEIQAESKETIYEKYDMNPYEVSHQGATPVKVPYQHLPIISQSMTPNVTGSSCENIELGPNDEEDVYTLCKDTATPPHQEETCTENPYDMNVLDEEVTPYQTLPPYVKVHYHLPIVSQSDDTHKRFGSMATYEISQASEIIRPANIIIGSFLAERPEEIVSLYDVCINSVGSILLSDPDNACLRILMGTSEASKKRSKYFRDSNPRAITYDLSSQRILMATSECLYQIDCDEKLKKLKERKLVKGINPLGIACSTILDKKFASNSKTYVTLWPRSGECIHCFSQNGEFKSKINIENSPFGIDYKKGYLVIATQKDGCLIKMSTSGNPSWDNTVDARQPGILQQPFGVAILPNDYIAVTETSAHHVSIFSDTGKLMKRFGGLGSEPGMFNSPLGIAVRLFKELVIVDSGNKRIQIFTLDSLGMLHRSSTVNQRH